MPNDPLDILASAPHPNNAEIGCGGSLLLAADQDWRVAVADLTDSERSSWGTLATHAQEKQRATELLGLTGRFSLGPPDTELGADSAQRLPLSQLIRAT